MANIRNITKKLVNLGFSEDKLMMMTEKEIREAYKVAKEGITMKNNTIDVEASNSETLDLEVEMEESLMNNNTNNVETNNSATVVKEEITMRELMNNTINRIMTATKVQDAEYVTRDELACIMEQLTGVRPGKKVTRKQMVQDLYVLEDDLQQMENANGSDCDSDTVVAVGDFCHDYAPESIESDPTPVVENPTPVSDAKAKTIELLNLIHDHAKDNQAKGYGTTISSHMLQAYILKVGHNVPKLKGHTVTKDEYETTIRVYKWLLNNGYIKPCAYSVNEDNYVRVYVADYDGKTGNVGHGTMYIPYNATNAAKYTIKKAVLFAVK